MLNNYFKKKVKFIKQLDSNDCGLACLAMILDYFEKPVTINQLKSKTSLSIEGITIENLLRQANPLGIHLIPLKIDSSSLEQNIALPAIAYWDQEHFIVVEKITRHYVYIVDPAFGKYKMPMSEFLNGWLLKESSIETNRTGSSSGILILVKPSADFDSLIFEKSNEEKYGWQFIKNNFLIYKGDNVRIFLSLFVISVLQLLLPFTNQLIVDFGIQTQNISFIYQVAIYASVFYILIAINEFLRSWNLAYLSTRINFSLISKFLKKITGLPIKTLYSRKIGDYIERIHDHKKLEEYFSDSVIKSLFSIFSIVAYAIVLVYFSFKIFLIIMVLTSIQLLWIFNFLGRIKTIDNKIFSLNAQDQDKVYEILSNLADIKLNNLEGAKNKEWQFIQGRLFENYLKKLKLNQIEQGGSKILNAIQMFSTIVLTAIFVVRGEITIGTMLSILFIINQLNFPLTQLINFIINTQIISNSFQRIFEIHNLQEENVDGIEPSDIFHKDISLENVSFQYSSSVPVLKDISFSILNNKITAIVGYSGSGKTTLIKLLLKFYENYSGKIFIGNNTNLKDIKSSYWRSSCGAVLQESSIYSDTIAYNITLESPGEISYPRLYNAIELASIRDFVNSFPLKLSTKLQSNGTSLSSGQKQRILIARLIYKNPFFVFLDEATNSLDSNTENVILNNLTTFFKNKTVVIVAHRLSTVKNADQIVVLNNGEIVEIGNHHSLINIKGEYFNLIKNQLELEYEGI